MRSASNHSAAEVFDLAAGNGTVVLWLNLEEQEKQRGEKVCSVIIHIPPPLSVATGKRRGRDSSHRCCFSLNGDRVKVALT